MGSVTRYLLFTILYLCPMTLAYRRHAPSTRSGIHWVQPNRSVLVRVETPDLPLWNPSLHLGEDIPSALILNFTFTRDNRVLLLNDQPILPFPKNVPPTLFAPQVSLSQSKVRQYKHFEGLSSFALDYYRNVAIGEDPNRHYNIYNPTLSIDILGAGIAGYNTLLKNDTQRYISIQIEERPPYQVYPFKKPISEREFMIKDVSLEDRYPFLMFSPPDSLQECTIWSWRCDDIESYPWYRYVYREAFDQYGKIGSARHEVYQRWGTARERLGLWQLVGLLIVVGSMVLSPAIYVVQRCVRRVWELKGRIGYKKVKVDEDGDLLDEHEWRLLGENVFEQPKKEVAKIEVEDKPLPPLPVESALEKV